MCIDNAISMNKIMYVIVEVMTGEPIHLTFLLTLFGVDTSIVIDCHIIYLQLRVFLGIPGKY